MPEQLTRGYTTFCFKPNQFTDDVAQWSDVCREAVIRVDEAAASAGGLAAAHEALARAGTGA